MKQPEARSLQNQQGHNAAGANLVRISGLIDPVNFPSEVLNQLENMDARCLHGRSGQRWKTAIGSGFQKQARNFFAENGLAGTCGQSHGPLKPDGPGISFKLGGYFKDLAKNRKLFFGLKYGGRRVNLEHQALTVRGEFLTHSGRRNGVRRAMSAVSVAFAKRRLAEFNNLIFHRNHADRNDGGIIRSQIDGLLLDQVFQSVPYRLF